MYITGKTKNIKFTDHVDAFSLKLDTCENQFKYLKAAVEAELGLGSPTHAFNFASKYSFKIGTAKVLLGVVSTTQTSAFSFSVSITVICNIFCIFLCFMLSVHLDIQISCRINRCCLRNHKFHYYYCG